MKKYLKNTFELIEFIAFFLILMILKTIGIKASRKICETIFSKIGPFIKSGWIVRNNLNYIFPNKTKSEIKILEEKIWGNFGCYAGEFPFLEEEYLKKNKLVKIIGAEKIHKLNDEKKNYIIFSAHLANWELVFNDIIPLIGESGVIYRKINNKFIDRYVKSKRSLKGVKLIPKGPYGAMDLIKIIKQKKNLMMLIDQKMNEGIRVNFLGKAANTAEAPAIIAREYGYGLIPVRIERSGDGFLLTIQDPIFVSKTENKNLDVQNTTQKLNLIISDWILDKPEEWLWMHQRWGKPNEMVD